MVLLVLASSGAALAPCNGPSTSRWSASTAYRQTAVFGKGVEDDRWLQGIAGIASNQRGEVFIYDLRNARVHVLDEQLRPKRSFGRRGGGPGELANFPMAITDRGPLLTNNLIAASNTAVYVFDNNRIQVYQPDGKFQRALPNTQFGRPSYFGVRYLHASTSGLLVGFDSLRMELPRERRFQTWVYVANARAKAHELPLTLPPISAANVARVGPQQARPLWAAQDVCVVVGDGQARELVRINIKSGVSDTLRLPENNVKVAQVSGRLAEAMQQAKARSGMPPSTHDLKPTSLVKWLQIQMDPDGHVWVRPYGPGRPDKTIDVYRIDPAGKVHQERLPAFPHAFGPPGVYYVRDTDLSTGEVFVARYSNGRTK